MCCICTCFASLLDLIQRAITFVLACWLAGVVCCGLTFAIVAGIAYGYNYSLAEFMTLSRSNVTVYLRRGKFSDTPDFKAKPRFFRRSGGDAFEGDDLRANVTGEYDESVEQQAARRSLSEAWVKAEDSRRYADWLTKFGQAASAGTESTDSDAPFTTYSYLVSRTPTPGPVSTAQPVTRTESTLASTVVFIKRFMSGATSASTKPAYRTDSIEPEDVVQEYDSNSIQNSNYYGDRAL